MNHQLPGIRDAVISAGSQIKLAEALGVSQQAIQQWVAQGYAPIGRIAEIEALYGIPRERLVDPRHLEPVARVGFEAVGGPAGH
jgi:DNA-binding transcriptional regulator YdaS (Cro superfamily)